MRLTPVLGYLLLASTAALAQQQILVPTRPPGDSTNAAASTAFTQNAASNPIPPLTIAPTPNSLTQGLIITQTPAGTQSGQFLANNITITSNAALTSANSFLDGINVNCSLQSTTVQGGVNCLQVTAGLNSPTNAGNANRNYVGITGIGQANTGDGGTNTGAGALGAIFGSNFVGLAVNGATNLLGVKGGEVNVALQTGSSAKLKAGWTVVTLGSDAVHGVSLDAGFALGAQAGALGLNQGYWLTNTNGVFPLATTGTIIGSDTGTVTHGADFSSVTCLSDCFKSTGFSIDGSGNLLANNVTTAWATFTSAPSCGTATITNNSSRSKTIGKTTFLQLDLTIAVLGTCTNTLSIALPNTAQSAAIIPGDEIANNSSSVGCRITAAGNTSGCFKQNSTLSNFVLNDRIVVSGVYENQ